MKEVSGLTAVDTLYEVMGLRLGQTFLEFLTTIYLPAVIAIAAICFVYYQCLERQSFRGLVAYVAYLLFFWWLITPVRTGVAMPAGTSLGSEEDFSRLYESLGQGAPEIRVPRFLLLLHSLTDNVVKVLVTRTNRTFLSSPFGSERLSARLRTCGINDGALRERFLRFVAG